jgi:hypothetical protein
VFLYVCIHLLVERFYSHFIYFLSYHSAHQLDLHHRQHHQAPALEQTSGSTDIGDEDFIFRNLTMIFHPTGWTSVYMRLREADLIVNDCTLAY